MKPPPTPGGAVGPTSEDLAACARRLGEAARAIGLSTLADRIVRDTERRLAAARPVVAVAGRTLRGKSSVVNALAGRDVVPVDAVPTTRHPVRVGGSVPPGPHLLGPDGMAEPLSRDRFEALVRGETAFEGRLVVGPLAPQEAAYEILDTPGVDLSAADDGAPAWELPSADVLILVLDATQVCTRAEGDFLEQALAATGGLGEAGVRLLCVVTRIDMVPGQERQAVRSHVHRALAGHMDPKSVFFVDLRGGTTPEETERLRAEVAAAARDRKGRLPLRAREDLARSAALLAHHLAIHRRALGLSREALEGEIAALKAAERDASAGVERARAAVEAARRELLEGLRADVAAFRNELETGAQAVAAAASLDVLADRLPGSIHDTCLLFVEREGEKLAEALENVSRRVLHTFGEDVASRLAGMSLRLAAHGPTVYVDPPSLALEAGTLAVGIAGTALMYFGSMATGMVMAVAGPLATVVLREQSVRRARDRLRARLTEALDEAVNAVTNVLTDLVERHLVALSAHVEQAGTDLVRDLLTQLDRARAALAAEGAPTHAARIEEVDRLLEEVRGIGERLAEAAATPSSGATPPPTDA